MLTFQSTVQKNISSVDTPVTKYLLAVSGGMDSMVLLDVFIRMGKAIQVAHVNYGFRKEEAAQEQALVEKICRENGIVCHTKKMDGYNDLDKHADNNLQSFARQVRYAFFNDIVEEEQLHYIVTAHHALDNIETVLFNILNKTSFLGLRGMNIVEGKILRPLLTISKEDVTEYAERRHVQYLNDSSNSSDTYTRNRIRNTLVPQVEKVFPQFKNNFRQNISGWNTIVVDYEKRLISLLSGWTKEEGPAVASIEVKRLLRSEALQDVLILIAQKYKFNRSQSEEIGKLLHAQNGALIENAFYQISRQNNVLYITDKAMSEGFFYREIIIEETTPAIELSYNHANIRISLMSNTAIEDVVFDAYNQYIDYDKMLSNKIIVRTRLQGDYFYPFGLNKKKKLSKYLIDRKMAIPEREKQLVVMCGQHIIALPGLTIDHRFQINTQTTRRVLHIRTTPVQPGAV